jgi:hypothetical protein
LLENISKLKEDENSLNQLKHISDRKFLYVVKYHIRPMDSRIFFVAIAIVAAFVITTAIMPVLAQNATGGNATGGNATGGNTTSAATAAGPATSEGGSEGEEGESYNGGGN